MIACQHCLIDLPARFWGANGNRDQVRGAGTTRNATIRRDKNLTAGGIAARDGFRTGCTHGSGYSLLLPLSIALAREMLFLPKASRLAARSESVWFLRALAARIRIGRLTPEITSMRPSSRNE